MTEPVPIPITLDELRYAIELHVGPQLAAAAEVETLHDILTEDLVLRLRTSLFAETLPPLTLTDTVYGTVPRFASWYDQFTATYRMRWWGRLLRLREPRFVDEPLTHTVSVSVLSRWTYPRATTILPGRGWGHAVLKADTRHDGRLRPW